jgi:hypothetical protein
MTTKTKEKYWVRVKFYEPFTMGGSVWRDVRYEVEGDPITLPRKIKGHVSRNAAAKKWVVHELTTGGFLGDGKTKKDAIECAKNNISITPDLEQQIAKMSDLMGLPETTTQEALRRLAKS